MVKGWQKMKIIMVVVTSINGKITRADESDFYKWTSKEDEDYFFDLLKKNKVVLMGSNSFNAVKEKIKPDPDRLRIILTSQPEKYNNFKVAGEIEFWSNTPIQTVKKLERLGYKKIILTGGGAVNSSFLKDGLVDEVWITIEPKLFGSGKPVTGPNNFDIDLKLKELVQLNKKGTLLLKYLVIK